MIRRYGLPISVLFSISHCRLPGSFLKWRAVDRVRLRFRGPPPYIEAFLNRGRYPLHHAKSVTRFNHDLPYAAILRSAGTIQRSEPLP